jgi:hypothetical protein
VNRATITALLLAALCAAGCTKPAPPPEPGPGPVPPASRPILYYLNSTAPLKPGTAAKLQGVGVTDVSILLTDNALNLYAPNLNRAEVKKRCLAFANAAAPLKWWVAVRAQSDLSLDRKFSPFSASSWDDEALWTWYAANLTVIAEEVKAAGGTGFVLDDEPYTSVGTWQATTGQAKPGGSVEKRAAQFVAALKGVQLRHCAPWGKVFKAKGWPAFWKWIHANQPATVFMGEETYVNAHNPPIVPKYAQEWRSSLGAAAKVAFGLSPTQPKYASDSMRIQFIKREGVWLYCFPKAPEGVEPLTEDPNAAPVVAAIKAIR